MKPIPIPRAIASLAFLFLLVSSAPGLAENGKVLGEADSEWPGVKFQVTDIQRIDAGHLLVIVRLRVVPEAANPTFISIEPPSGLKPPKGATPEEVASGKYERTPFSLQKAVLYEESSGQKYPALPDLPTQPFFGPNAVFTTLRPGNWLQLAVQFPAPPPSPPTASGVPPEQKATLVLPKAKGPIRHLSLPPVPAG